MRSPMSSENLGVLAEVNVREIWPDEARDFTPWLADNLSQLGAAINRDLQVIETEGEVGSRSVDIVADSELGVVVIENQLEETDPDHLGRLLSYAAGRDASVLIWVAPSVTDEHRAVLDWLNRRTIDGIEAFGVEVRAVRIGQSLPAAEFRAVAFPNTWSRRISRGSSASSQNEKYRDFFNPVMEHLHGKGLTHRRTATAQGFQVFRSETQSILGVALNYNLRCWSDGSLGVKLHLANKEGTLEDRLRVFDSLFEKREAIERALGYELHWDRFDTWTYSQVQAVRMGSVDDTDSVVEGHRQWMQEQLPRVIRVLSPYLAEIAMVLEAEQEEGIEGSLIDEDID